MKRFSLALLALGFVGTAVAAPWKVDAVNDLRTRYGLEGYNGTRIRNFGENLSKIKVGIIDNGYGDQEALKRDLPAAIFKTVFNYPEAFLAKHPRLGPFADQYALDDKQKHGREMAAIAWGMTGGSRTEAPQFTLLNGKGLVSLDRAIQWCIDEKFDIILYSQNWEYGGNFDGNGFINAMVTRATNAGILWINAAGNYGGRVFNGPVKFERGVRAAGPDTWLDLDGRGKKELRVLSRLDDNPARIVLSWNRNTDDRKSGTDTDLDLFLYDEDGTLVASSETVQKLGGPDLNLEEDKGETLAREVITKELSKNDNGGHYTLRVKAKAGIFRGTDRFRITVIPLRSPIADGDTGRYVDPVQLVDASSDREIMVPADHPDVITVGDLTRFSAKGPTADGRAKPDFHMPTSAVDFTSGVNIAGTSAAAAMFAGIAAVLKAVRPTITKEELLTFVKQQLPSEAQRGANRGILDLGVSVVRERQQIVFDAINARLKGGQGEGGSAIVLGGRYFRDGTYVIALDRSPSTLNRWWRNIPSDERDAQGSEIYMKATEVQGGRIEAWSYVRSRQRDENARPAAWETDMKENPEKYVQVIQAIRPATDDKEKEVPMWVTPTPAEVRALRSRR